MDWINVKEDLPKSNDDVLAYSKKEIFMAQYNGKHWSLYFSDAGLSSLLDYMDVTHWLPLPKPPKAK